MLQNGTFKDNLRKLSPRFLERLWSRIESSPLGKRLLRGTIWTLLGTVVSRALGLGAAIFAARILGKAVYGELGILQSTVGMLGTFAGFGMGTTATKYVAELRSRNPAKAGGCGGHVHDIEGDEKETREAVGKRGHAQGRE